MNSMLVNNLDKIMKRRDNIAQNLLSLSAEHLMIAVMPNVDGREDIRINPKGELHKKIVALIEEDYRTQLTAVDLELEACIDEIHEINKLSKK